ncbi:MAG: AAA family ATPase [Bacteroidales bacterium]|jgi:exodeoxyribonuclease-5|nr:AAA family ATPase [Bacteroidales bacterium]
MTDPGTFAKQWQEAFPYPPTHGQSEAIGHISEYITRKGNDSMFLLKGYAGTGKTSLISSLVNMLKHLRMRSVLLAPTGRAAKVISSYSGRRAYTIHRKLYMQSIASDGRIRFVLTENKHKNTLFIVDEASMIPDTSASDGGIFSGKRLLQDLMEYVYSGENCRLLMIGDTAQLPPVGIDLSPALHPDYLKNNFNLRIISYELREVVRQSRESGILANATELREKISDNRMDMPFFHNAGYDDVFRVDGNELQEFLQDVYASSRQEDIVVICRSNKRANIYNREIRNRILYHEDELCAGDHLMVVRNNYFWLPRGSEAGFIANGDMIEILRIRNIKQLYGHRFADVTFRLIDYPEEKEIDALIMLDTLMADSPALPQDEQKRLLENVMLDYANIPSYSMRMSKVSQNQYFNALQVKFAYALTCHKTQGGQWKHVFVDQGYLKEDMVDREYLRWLYTSLTRASVKVYLINFLDRFWE